VTTLSYKGCDRTRVVLCLVTSYCSVCLCPNMGPFGRDMSMCVCVCGGGHSWRQQPGHRVCGLWGELSRAAIEPG
jgi:hypothetical protein